LLPIFFVAAGLVIWKNGGVNSHGWADTAMLGVFILLMIWLLSPRRSDKRTGHDSPAE
jgi:hypothetical protein